MSSENLDEVSESLCRIARNTCKKLNLSTCVIICTRQDVVDEDGDSVTALLKGGAGNYYGQYGSVKKWLDEQ